MALEIEFDGLFEVLFSPVDETLAEECSLLVSADSAVELEELAITDFDELDDCGGAKVLEEVFV